MSVSEILNTYPKLSSVMRRSDVDNKFHLWDNFYFYQVTEIILKRANKLAKKISRISRGKRTLILSDNSELVGKVGEFVVREFCREYLTCEWDSNVEFVNEHGGDLCDLFIEGSSVDVKTRQLHGDVTIAPTIELRVPVTELDREQAVYVLAGYCPESAYGYVFGWCSWEELQAQPIREDIKFPARCVALTELHPMFDLQRYLLARKGWNLTHGHGVT